MRFSVATSETQRLLLMFVLFLFLFETGILSYCPHCPQTCDRVTVTKDSGTQCNA